MPAVRTGTRGAVITGWGTALPPKILTNADLEQMMDTNDQWIVERTGIRERHVGGTTADLSIESARQALDMAGLQPGEIDGLILATTTPDRRVPATASTVQHELGLSCGAFDVNAACSGWVYALINAHGMIAMGADKVLVVGTDTLARIVDWTDRNTAILFADGSGAVVIEAVDGPGQLLAWDLDSDGSAERFLYCDFDAKMQMDGKEVFRRAVRVDGRLRQEVDGARRRHRRRHRPRRAAPGEHPHHQRGLRPSRDRPRSHRHRARPHRQHVVGIRPVGARRRRSTTAVSRMVTSCSSSASAPG